MNRKWLSFIVLSVLLIGLFFWAVNTGGIKISFLALWRGLFIEYSRDVEIIFDLRFPRIFVALLAGAALAVSGVLLQAVMKNPLADPGIIGVSAGAGFFSAVVVVFFPAFFFFIPIFAFIGGIAACLLVYSLSWKSGLSPLRIILVGIAINAVFTGLLNALKYVGGSSSGNIVNSIINSGMAMKTWVDVRMLIGYVLFGVAASLLAARQCNLLALEDKTVRNLGVNVTLVRIIVSAIAVLLASISTAVIGAVSFVGLIVPHIARLLVGTDHKVLLPFSVLLGGFTMLFADTVGRTIAYPYEIPAAIVMAVVGGVFFIFLLRRSESLYGN